MVDVEQFDPVDPRLVEQFEVLGTDFVTRLDIDLAGGFVDQVIGRIPTVDFLGGDQQAGQGRPWRPCWRRAG